MSEIPVATAVRERSGTSLLWILSFANFAVGMGAFVVIGVLSPVASDLGIGTAQAGSLLTVYSIVYAVTSPLLVATTGRFDRVWALVAAMAVFSIGAIAMAASGSLTGATVARCVMALGAGIITPVGASIAVAAAGSQGQGRALAIVFGGMTLAQALGVPIGAWLGYTFGWRTAFALVAALGLLSAGLFIFALPRNITVPVATLASLGAVFRSAPQTIAVSFTALFTCALFVFYTYLAPFIEARYQLEREGVTLVLMLFGFGAVAGNAVGGWLSDRIGARRSLALLASTQLVLLPLLTWLALPLGVFCFALAVWSVCSWSTMVPQQARLASIAPERVPVLFALNAAAIYVGGSLGSALGGFTLHDAGFRPLGMVGAGVALLALVSIFLVRGDTKRNPLARSGSNG